MDTGGGYCSQNVMPVHFGLSDEGPLDIEVTSFTSNGRAMTHVAGVSSGQLPHPILEIKVP
jgi:hypothetical protein